MTNGLIIKSDEQKEKERYASQQVAEALKGTGGETESPELTELKDKLTESKELFKAMVAWGNVALKKYKSESARTGFKQKASEIKAKLNGTDVNEDSEAED